MTPLPTSVTLSDDRQCAGCTECCTAIGVAEIRKPMYAACKDLCLAKKMCGIYSSRPESCGGYKCGWLQGFLPSNCRPDRLGVIFQVGPHPSKIVMEVVETRPDALRKKRVGWAVEEVCRQTYVDIVLLVPYGKRITQAYPIDTDTYPQEQHGLRARCWQQHDVQDARGLPVQFQLFEGGMAA